MLTTMVVVVELTGVVVVVADPTTVVVVDSLVPENVVVVVGSAADVDPIATVTVALGPDPFLFNARTLKTYFSCLPSLTNTQRYVSDLVAETVRVSDPGLLVATYRVTGSPFGALVLCH